MSIDVTNNLVFFFNSLGEWGWLLNQMQLIDIDWRQEIQEENCDDNYTNLKCFLKHGYVH